MHEHARVHTRYAEEGEEADDMETLEEELRSAPLDPEQVKAEVDALQLESEMPIERVLQMYGAPKTEVAAAAAAATVGGGGGGGGASGSGGVAVVTKKEHGVATGSGGAAGDDGDSDDDDDSSSDSDDDSSDD